MKSRLIGAVVASLALLFSLSAHATLLSRLGGLAYYDTEANLTWLADADAGYGSSFDSADGTINGKMSWDNATSWAASLNIDGVTGWRLPTTGTSNASAACLGYGCTDSEMGNLFYNVLGNLGYCVSSNICPGSTQPGWGLNNTGPFSNIQTDYYYWSSSQYLSYTTSKYMFRFWDGEQGLSGVTQKFYAWAVHDGDVGPTTVPEPPTLALVGIGLVSLVSLARRSRLRA